MRARRPGGGVAGWRDDLPGALTSSLASAGDPSIKDAGMSCQHAGMPAKLIAQDLVLRPDDVYIIAANLDLHVCGESFQKLDAAIQPDRPPSGIASGCRLDAAGASAAQTDRSFAWGSGSAMRQSGASKLAFTSAASKRCAMCCGQFTSQAVTLDRITCSGRAR